MTGATIITVGALFLALFIAIAAVMMWQEAKARSATDAPTYVIEDAIATVANDLEPERLSRIGRAGVRRIIEWEVFYLQGLADKKAARQGITVVAGGDELAVSYIREQLERRGHEYNEDDVRAVLQGEAAYLADIGVVGEAVGPAQMGPDPTSPDESPYEITHDEITTENN